MTHKLPKVLGLKDLTLFTVSGIILLDTLTPAVKLGAASLTWWVFLGTVFMLPVGMITAELGTAIAAEGGIYVWIRRAFGERWAARASWAYWINAAIWLPSIFVLFTGILGRLLDLEFSTFTQVMIGVGLAWLTVLMDVYGLKVTKWVPDIGAFLKVIIFGALIIGGFRYAAMNGFATEISLSSMTPSWSEALKYLPAVVYGMLGFELVSAAGGEIQHPKRNVPLAIMISGVLILFLYTASTAGILAAVNADDLDIVEGLVDTLFMLFADLSFGPALVYLLGAATLFTFFSNAATWAMGCNRAAAEAARESELPAFWAWRKSDASGPTGAAVMMGIVMTLVLVVYGAVANSNEDLFWMLFSNSAVIFMLPYVGMALAFIRLRSSEPDLERPYRVPGGQFGALLVGGTVTAILLTAIGLFIYVPNEGWSRPAILCFIVAAVIGEVLISHANRQKLSARE